MLSSLSLSACISFRFAEISCLGLIGRRLIELLYEIEFEWVCARSSRSREGESRKEASESGAPNCDTVYIVDGVLALLRELLTLLMPEAREMPCFVRIEASNVSSSRWES